MGGVRQTCALDHCNASGLDDTTVGHILTPKVLQKVVEHTPKDLRIDPQTSHLGHATGGQKATSALYTFPLAAIVDFL